MAERGLVLITGGSGYVAGFCIAKLIGEGWHVRTTLRNLAREDEVRHTLAKLCDISGKLDFCAADLTSHAGWTEAAKGCDYVLHVASPFPSVNPKDDDELVRPARDGALRVLQAARDEGVKRVVMTASFVTIAYGHGSRQMPFTEDDWTDETNRADTSAYERSKTIAERAARDWLAQEGGALELVTIHPGAVLGPVFGQDFSTSIEIVKKMMDGSLWGLPQFGWPLVDVRDIADLHYRAMLAEGVAGERFIGGGPFLWTADIARVLKTKLGTKAKSVPSLVLPNFLVRLAAQFDPIIRSHLWELGKFRPVSSEKAKRVLGWSPRPCEETILATAESLIAEGQL